LSAGWQRLCSIPFMRRSNNLVQNHGAKFFLLHWLICTVTLIALPALQAESISLAWNPSADPYVAGYKIYYGVASHVYTSLVDVGNVTNAIVNGLSQNMTYYFAATSYDVNGVESSFSNETNLVPYAPAILIPLPPPPNLSLNGQVGFTNYILGAANVVPAITNIALGVTNIVPGVTNYLNYLYKVQVSTNLVNWVSVETNTAPFMFVDTNMSQFRQRFYRVVNLSNPTNY